MTGAPAAGILQAAFLQATFLQVAFLEAAFLQAPFLQASNSRFLQAACQRKQGACKRSASHLTATAHAAVVHQRLHAGCAVLTCCMLCLLW